MIVNLIPNKSVIRYLSISKWELTCPTHLSFYHLCVTNHQWNSEEQSGNGEPRTGTGKGARRSQELPTYSNQYGRLYDLKHKGLCGTARRYGCPGSKATVHCGDNFQYLRDLICIIFTLHVFLIFRLDIKE